MMKVGAEDVFAGVVEACAANLADDHVVVSW